MEVRGKHRGIDGVCGICAYEMMAKTMISMMHSKNEDDVDDEAERSRESSICMRNRREPSAPKARTKSEVNPRSRPEPDVRAIAHALHSLACCTAAHLRLPVCICICGRGTRSGRRSAKPRPVRSMS